MRKILILISLATGLMACAEGPHGDSEQDTLSQTAATVPVVIENLGAACKVAADCKGTDTRCITTSEISKLTYPGGFCSAGCKSDAECGEKGWCPLAALDAGVFPSAEVQKGVTICLQKCETVKDCREGYVCSAESSLSFVPPAAAGTVPQTYCRPPVPAAAK